LGGREDQGIRGYGRVQLKVGYSCARETSILGFFRALKLFLVSVAGLDWDSRIYIGDRWDDYHPIRCHFVHQIRGYFPFSCRWLGLLGFVWLYGGSFLSYRTDSTSQMRVESVLDCVVRTAWKIFSDFGPLGPVFGMQFDNFRVLFFGERVFTNLGVQMVHPALSALLSKPPGDALRDIRPLAFTMGLDPNEYQTIFVGCPRTFLDAWVEHLPPAMQALDVRFGPSEALESNGLPVLFVVLLDCTPKCFIILGSPFNVLSRLIGVDPRLCLLVTGDSPVLRSSHERGKPFGR